MNLAPLRRSLVGGSILSGIIAMRSASSCQRSPSMAHLATSSLPIELP